MSRVALLAVAEKRVPAFRPGERKPPRRAEAGEWRREAPAINLAAYRGRTVALVRRYARMAVQQGRLPSIIGREFFRARVSHYRLRTFEDDVIFTFDVERCLEQLAPFDRALLGHVVLEEYTQDDAALLLSVTRRTVSTRFPLALDGLTLLVLQRELMRALPGDEDFLLSRAKKRH